MNLLFLFSFLLFISAEDQRNTLTGKIIVDHHKFAYMDTVSVLTLPNKDWLAILHVSTTKESAPDQHVISLRSLDQGLTWGNIQEIEPCHPYGPPSGRASPFLTSTGRIYVFFNYNSKNITKNRHDTTIVNAFVGGEFYRYSDDNGKSWIPAVTEEPIPIPMEVKGIDKRNEFAGEVLEGYGVGKVVQHNNDLFVQYSKRTNVPPNVTSVEIQNFLLYSPNILVSSEPSWKTLPDGSEGCTANHSINAHEGNILFYEQSKIYFPMRTTSGFVSVSTSDDNGRVFSNDQYAYYYKVDLAPNQKETKSTRKLVNSDSPLSPRSFGNGRYLLPFYNTPGDNYMGRNPLWISGGVEAEGTILWGQPELLLYSEYKTAFAYPDLFNHNGEWFITESNKTVARVHKIDKSLLDGLFQQNAAKNKIEPEEIYFPPYITIPTTAFPSFAKQESLTMNIALTVHASVDAPILTCGDFSISVKNSAINVKITHDSTTVTVKSEPILEEGVLHDVTLVMDGMAKVAYLYIDGQFMDGQQVHGNTWQFLTPLSTINYDTKCTIDTTKVSIKSIQMNRRAVRTHEVIGNFRYNEESSLPLVIILAASFGGVIVIAIIAYLVYEFRSRRNKPPVDQEALLIAA